MTKSRIPVVRRSYAAALTNPLYADFSKSNGSADYELRTGLRVVRNKARALARNSSSMKRYIQLLKDNVVGENGVRLQVRMKSAAGKLNKSVNAAVEAAWLEFCEAPTVDETMDIIDLQKLVIATWARDGEFISEIVYGRKWADGFVLAPIEADQLDETLTTKNEKTGNVIIMGVEVDEHKKPVAYHFLTQHPGDLTWYSPMTRKRYRRVPAERVIHIFEKLRVGQTRGEPPASAVVHSIKMLDGNREAEIVQRRIKASAMGFFTKETADAPHGIDALADEQNENDELQINMEPGTFKELPEGYGFETFDPGGSQTDFAEADIQFKTDIAVGLGISTVSLGMETGKLSYSTHRGVIAEDRDMYKGLQSFLIRHLMRRVFKLWLVSHVSYSVETSIRPLWIKGILKSFKFRARGWEAVDISKDTSAENEQLEAKTTSITRVLARRGIDIVDHVEELAADEELYAEYGLTLNAVDATSDKTKSGDDDDKDDDET
jgi:lambda family phage portal protein